MIPVAIGAPRAQPQAVNTALEPVINMASISNDILADINSGYTHLEVRFTFSFDVLCTNTSSSGVFRARMVATRSSVQNVVVLGALYVFPCLTIRSPSSARRAGALTIA
jgi:hypothetical protein